MFQHSPAAVMQGLLIALGVGADPDIDQSDGAWPVFLSAEPDLPDECITVYDTAWRSDGRAMVTGETFNHYGVQIRVRARTHAEGFVKANGVREKLDQHVRQTAIPLDSSVYDVHAVSGTQVLSIGQDTPQTKRQLFTMNPVLALTQLQ